MKIILPAVLNPISRRKDKSVRISFETRELSPDETLGLMAVEGLEMWVALAPNSDELDTPKENAELDTKSPAQRLRDVLFVLYKQRVEDGKYVGLFNSFYQEKMEGVIDFIKSKLHE